MKLNISIFTILITVINVNCGLVKDFFGNVREDVHTVVGNTVDIIEKGTHKITEGLGVFLHRNEGNKFPNQNVDIYVTTTYDNTYDGANYKQEENTPTKGNAQAEQNNQVQPIPTDKQTISNENDLSDTQNATNELTTESIINKNVPELTTKKSIKVALSTTTAGTTTTSTTESTLWTNGAALENILPTIMHNETYITNNNTYALNSESETLTNNELGNSEIVNNETPEFGNKTAKQDDNQPTESTDNERNLISDQMFFKDNKPQPEESSANNTASCSGGLVRAANGDCLEPIEIDVRQKNKVRVYNMLQANGCATGYARAEDSSCQKIVAITIL